MITPELVAQIYEEVKKAYLKKDGTPFKREKTFWIKNLIKIVAKNLSLNKEVVEKGINNLIDNCYLMLTFRAEVYYRSIYLEKVRKLNKLLKKMRDLETFNDEVSQWVYGKRITRGVNTLTLTSEETIDHFIKDSEQWIEIARKISESKERINEVKKRNV